MKIFDIFAWKITETKHKESAVNIFDDFCFRIWANWLIGLIIAIMHSVENSSKVLKEV